MPANGWWHFAHQYACCAGSWRAQKTEAPLFCSTLLLFLFLVCLACVPGACHPTIKAARTKWTKIIDREYVSRSKTVQNALILLGLTCLEAFVPEPIAQFYGYLWFFFLYFPHLHCSTVERLLGCVYKLVRVVWVWLWDGLGRKISWAAIFPSALPSIVAHENRVEFTFGSQICQKRLSATRKEKKTKGI